MRAIQFLRDFFGGKNLAVLTQQISRKAYLLSVEDFAIQLAVNLIAGLVAKCEFRTLSAGKPAERDDYFLWNVSPNANQSGYAFKTELVSKLLYYNECLVVESGGQLIIADDFQIPTDYALRPNRFTGVRRGDFTFRRDFTADQVLYFTYANKDIRALASGLMNGYRELLEMAVGKYKRAGGRKGVIDAEVTPQQDKKWAAALDDLYGKRFKSYFNEENALVVLPRGVKYTEISGEGSKKSTSEVTDIVNLTRETFSRAAQAFRLPAALLMGEVAGMDGLMDQALTAAVSPVIECIQAECNRGYYGKDAYIKGYRMQIDATHIKHTDLFSAAEQADKLIASGIYCIDELRLKLGDIPLDTWWSRQHWRTKNYAEIERLEGGVTENGKDIPDHQGGKD